MADLARMGSHFSRWSHRAFILFSILSVLVAALSGRRSALAAVQQSMQCADRALLDAVPAVGRYCWETVIVLAR